MDNQVHNSIVSFIWGIADDCLRDVYVRGKYRDVILPMTVIRRLDALLEDTKDAVLDMKKMLDNAGIDNQWPALCNAAGQAFCNASPFRLRDLTSRAKKQKLKSDFEAYLDGFSPNVQEILEKFKFRNQLDTMLDADILGAVVEKFMSSDINLSPKPIYKDEAKTILKYGNADWERLSIFLNFLVPKLPSPSSDDLTKGILETIDLESYRNEAKATMSIVLEDKNTEVDPVPTGSGGRIVNPELDTLSSIVAQFNDIFGNIEWNDADNVIRQIQLIPGMVSKDEKYRNAMKNSDEQNARMESERALQNVILSIMKDNMELFKQFQDNPSFKSWLSNMVFNLTYNHEGKTFELT